MCFRSEFYLLDLIVSISWACSVTLRRAFRRKNSISHEISFKLWWMEFIKVELQAARWSPLKSTPLCWFWMIQLILIGCANFKVLVSESVFLVWSSALNQSLKHYNLNSSHPSWSNVKENKMSQTNSQCRGLTITSLKMGTCVTTFLDWGLLRKTVFFILRSP